jgi:hypothetical protein
MGKSVIAISDVGRHYAGVVVVNPSIQLRFEGGLLRVLTPADIHPMYISGLNDPQVNRYLDVVKKNSTNSGVGVVSSCAVISRPEWVAVRYLARRRNSTLRHLANSWN